MVDRSGDGSVGDADYQHLGASYARYRRPDPRIAERITAALGSARTVLNVGAGAGSYEPTDREVTPVEPSETMRAQRADHLPSALDAVAEHLPFPDDSFDAAMTTFSVHQWRDTGAGLREIRRVTRGPVVILTCDPRLLDGYWLNEHAPRVIEAEQRRYPPLSELESGLNTALRTTPVPIPLDCSDGFNEAYYGRPEMLLDPAARQSCSAWSFLDATSQDRFALALEHHLVDGTWDRRFGHLRTQPFYEGSLVIAVTN
ncbi:MAG: class I SAM-dependent methyltransferase [Acidimicrobiales bacterium]